MKKPLLTGTAMDLVDPSQRYLLFAKRDDAGGGSEVDASAAERAVTADTEIVAAADKGAAAAPEASGAAPDWRAGITDDAARAFANSSTDITHLAKRGMEMREKLSKAVFVPGRDSSAEEIAAFNKAMGVPETAGAYQWPAPPDGQALTDDVKAMRAEWSQFFHDSRFTRTQAETALAKMVDINARLEETRLATDKSFAAEQEAMLRADWPGDEFAKNKEMANRAARHLFGGDFTTIAGLEAKDGRLVMDNAMMARVFARIGREMSEGGVGVPINETEYETIDTEIEGLRKKQAEANASGDRRQADKFYQDEMALIQKRDGKQGLVGSDGRAA